MSGQNIYYLYRLFNESSNVNIGILGNNLRHYLVVSNEAILPLDTRTP